MATKLARKQTEERIARGVALLRAELERQAKPSTAEIDLRALYLAIDERAARYDREGLLKDAR